jgi:diaminopimelate decarboxylase
MSFRYVNQRLMAEDVDVAELAGTIQTPFYLYSAAALRANYQRLVKAIAHPRVTAHYAIKANSSIAVLRVLANEGAHMDIVSAGEMKRCLAAGVPGKHIVFAGVGKTDAEIAFALTHGIYQFNVESRPELQAINRVAQGLGLRAPVALRINPDVEADTHAKISTGSEETKFGIAWDQVENIYAEAAQLPNVDVLGLTAHIGSQITDVAPFEEFYGRMKDMVARLRGKGMTVSRVSLGGGFGIDYGHGAIDVMALGAAIRRTADDLQCDVQIEPGRYLVADAGILVSKVIYVKHGTVKHFLIVDAAMNDLIRPTLYEAHHPLDKAVQDKAAPETYDVVGPVCETGDFLALDRTLPACRAGEFIVLFCAGAYGAAMSSMYNSRALIGEMLVDGAKTASIRQILTIEQQLAWETMPDWL